MKYAILLVLAACNVNSWDPVVKPTPDMPCGLGVVCSTKPVVCCPQDFTCKADGTCEFIGHYDTKRMDGGTD